MTVAERMRRDGWRESKPQQWTKSVAGLDCVVVEWFSGAWWIMRSREVLKVSDFSFDYGIRCSAQRAKAAARRLARQRGK